MPGKSDVSRNFRVTRVASEDLLCILPPGANQEQSISFNPFVVQRAVSPRFGIMSMTLSVPGRFPDGTFGLGAPSWARLGALARGMPR